MSDPVDLTNLRTMTDADKDMEKELFGEFLSSFDAGITSLQLNTAPAAAEAWRKQAHALKGMALNLGAMKLGELCKKAQEDPAVTSDVKMALLGALRNEFEKVKQFLLATMM